MPYVLDLDGVVWLGDQPIPGATEAVADLRAGGEPILFVTNYSYGRVADLVEKLARQGIEADHDDVVTSSVVAASLAHPGERVLVVGGPGIVEELTRRGCEAVREGSADAVLVGYDPEFDYRKMTVASQAVRGGARLLATNDDSTYPTPAGLLPGGGAILASIERASGVSAVIAGKPYQPICDYVHARLGPDGIAVGDRADTDGRFARALGYRFALVLTGATTADDLPVDPEPDEVAVDLRSLIGPAPH